MKVYFGTKEENNRRRQGEFLKLSPAERIESFLRDAQVFTGFPEKQNKPHPNDKKGNFVIDLTDENLF